MSKLLSWDWRTVLEVCTDNHLDQLELPDTVPEHVERAWLSSKERIITNVFNGVKVKKPKTCNDAEIELELIRADGRIGKQRVVEIDGYQVTKENLRLGSNEPSSPKSPTELNKKDPIVHYSAARGLSMEHVLIKSSSGPVHTRTNFIALVIIARHARRRQRKLDICYIPANHASEPIANGA
ncbi:hypothetical protein PHISCL_07270 [Aspergillus sclerotialis]|uniref:Uncharacterized protein n=1 Tax=Aspergillus sclerotialis TaxID=2070753 RepID=A0A3A2ZB73_9EURO|nr:hypothetical protein PHISCL_07270 [Aspergillus sclerotialis]